MSPCLVGCTSAGTVAPRDREVDQRRLRGHVDVPQIVVHGLEHPAQLAGREFERDDALANFSVVGGRSPPHWSTAPMPERQIDHAQFLVGRRRLQLFGDDRL